MAEESTAEVKETLDRAEVSLVLDTYDDIFSDFDPRPYNERALSMDFLVAAKRAARDKGIGIELLLLMPGSLRNAADEELIKLRLRGYFRKSCKSAEEELARINRNAAILVIIGISLGFADVMLLTLKGVNALIIDSLDIVLTPASWFTIWTGFDNLLIKPKEAVSDKEFYKKMASARITFTSY